MGESEASIRGRVMRDLISHVTNDHLIGKKIKSGELRKKISGAEAPWKCPDCFEMTVIETEKFRMELLTAKASRGESSFRGKGSAPGCIPKLGLPRPD